MFGLRRIERKKIPSTIYVLLYRVNNRHQLSTGKMLSSGLYQIQNAYRSILSL